MTSYLDLEYENSSGLRLYARDYAHDSPRATLLCLPGTTANSADFEGVAAYLAADYRLVAPDLRGRGRSEFEPGAGGPLQTLDMQDMLHLWDLLELERVVVLGTSLSGHTAMGIAAMVSGRPLGPAADALRARLSRVRAESLLGFIMNDIGPELGPGALPDAAALQRSVEPVDSWEDAIQQVREAAGPGFDDYADADWKRVARARYREGEQGRPELAYHPAVLPPPPEPSASAEPHAKLPDLWPLFEMLHDVPALVIRGACSRTMTEECLEEMRRRKPALRTATVPRRGHCPNLTEPESKAAIEQFLDALTPWGS